MIKIYYRSVREIKLSTLDKFKTGAWVNVYDPSGQDIDDLHEMLGVEKSLLQDALDPYEVPRLEQENGTTYVFTRVPERVGQEVMTVPLLIVLGDNFVLTFSQKKFGFLNKFVRGEVGFFTTQKTKFFLEIFSGVNRQYNVFLIEVGKGIRSLKFKLEKMSNKDLIHFVDLERVLNDFLSALVPAGSALKKMLDGRSVHLYEDDQDLIEDIFLDNGQLTEMARSTLQHVINIRDTYSNIITQDLNRVMKILTSLTILLTIPTMIFSFYGMNVALPHANSAQAYNFILILTLAISVSLLILFKRNRWL